MEKILLVFNRNAELLRLVGATFYSKVASLRRMMKKNLIILKSLPKRKPFFVLFVLSLFLHLSCQISIESVRNIFICSLNILMTECRIWNFSQYYNNLFFFYWTIINWNFICEILFSIMAFIEIYAIKVSVWTRYNTFIA